MDPNRPKPTLSEHSTSSINYPKSHQTPSMLETYAYSAGHEPINICHVACGQPGSAAAAETPGGTTHATGDQLMLLDVSEDIRLGTPDDGSKNLEFSDIQLLADAQQEDSAEHHRELCAGMSRCTGGIFCKVPLVHITNLIQKGGCDFFAWENPPMCYRAMNIIPGLKRKINVLEEENRKMSRENTTLKLILVLPWLMLFVLWMFNG